MSRHFDILGLSRSARTIRWLFDRRRPLPISDTIEDMATSQADFMREYRRLLARRYPTDSPDRHHYPHQTDFGHFDAYQWTKPDYRRETQQSPDWLVIERRSLPASGKMRPVYRTEHVGWRVVEIDTGKSVHPDIPQFDEYDLANVVLNRQRNLYPSRLYRIEYVSRRTMTGQRRLARSPGNYLVWRGKQTREDYVANYSPNNSRITARRLLLRRRQEFLEEITADLHVEIDQRLTGLVDSCGWSDQDPLRDFCLERRPQLAEDVPLMEEILRTARWASTIETI